MREGGRAESLHVEAPVVVGSVTLLPVKRIVRHAQGGDQPRWLSVTMAPYALVLRDAAGTRVVNADGAATSLDALREDVPQVDAALAAIGCFSAP